MPAKRCDLFARWIFRRSHLEPQRFGIGVVRVDAGELGVDGRSRAFELDAHALGCDGVSRRDEIGHDHCKFIFAAHDPTIDRGVSALGL